MGKAHGRVLVDESTYTHLPREGRKNLRLAEEMVVKGKAAAIRPYEYVSAEDALQHIGDDPNNAAQSVSLSEEVAVYLSQQLDKNCYLRLRNTSVCFNAPILCMQPSFPSSSPLSRLPLSTSTRLFKQPSLAEPPREVENHVLNMTVLVGNPGTGKSTAADYFKQGAKKRNLHTVFVQACESDIIVRYGVISRVFWGLLGPSVEFEGQDLSQKIAIVDGVLNQLAEHSQKAKERSGPHVLSKSGKGNQPYFIGTSAEHSMEYSPERSAEFISSNVSRISFEDISVNSDRNVLLRILGLECSASHTSGGAVEEPHVTVLDRRMSKTSTAPKG
jgi:hypothetical protein